MRKVRANALVLTAALAIVAPGLWGQAKQAQASGQAASETAAQAGKSGAAIESGTKISAELITAVDSRSAKPGQEVVARVTKDVKQKGKAVIHKGDRLVGTVQSVEANAAADAGSRLAVTFDRLVQGESTSQLSTVLSAVVSTPREQRERMQEPAPTPAPMPAPSGGGSGGGGLVGGVTSTVGSTVGATTSAVGGVGSAVGATTQSAVGATAGAGLATPARLIRLDSQASAEGSASSNSMLSTRQGHLFLESGTQMQFRVASQTQAEAKKPEAPAKKQ